MASEGLSASSMSPFPAKPIPIPSGLGERPLSCTLHSQPPALTRMAAHPCAGLKHRKCTQVNRWGLSQPGRLSGLPLQTGEPRHRAGTRPQAPRRREAATETGSRRVGPATL